MNISKPKLITGSVAEVYADDVYRSVINTEQARIKFNLKYNEFYIDPFNCYIQLYPIITISHNYDISSEIIEKSDDIETLITSTFFWDLHFCTLYFIKPFLDTQNSIKDELLLKTKLLSEPHNFYTVGLLTQFIMPHPLYLQKPQNNHKYDIYLIPNHNTIIKHLNIRTSNFEVNRIYK